MSTFDIVTIHACDPWRFLGLEISLLEAIGSGIRAPVLIIGSTTGKGISIARYHRFAGSPNRGGSIASRRLTGGRLYGCGDGWIRIALILPSHSALLPPRDEPLKPEQVMNRYARGVLNAMRSLGLDPFYPGRDAITVGGREMAMCSFETNGTGAMLFEAFIAVNCGLEELIHELERFDPEGQLSCPMYHSRNASKLVRELDRDISFGEIADRLAHGYSELLGGGKARDLDPIDLARADLRAAEFSDPAWLEDEPPAGSRVSRISSQLGAIEAHALASGPAIQKLRLFGDFIANSGVVSSLEAAFSGTEPDPVSVSRRVTQTFATGDNYFLGAGDLSNLVNLINGLNEPI